jgi:hypothetical protein
MLPQPNTPLRCLPIIEDLSWADEVAYLAYTFSKGPHEEFPIWHRFEPGWYIRTIRIPAGKLLLGRPHRDGHIVKLLEGTVLHVQPEGKVYRHAPYRLHTCPGYIMIAYAVTNVMAETWHPVEDDVYDVRVLEERIADTAQSMLNHGRVVADRVDYALALQEQGITQGTVYERFRLAEEGAALPTSNGYKVELGVSRIHGKGVYTSAPFAADDTLAPMHIGGQRTWVGRYLNHSVEPNARAVAIGDDIFAIATGPIPQGTELTVNYRQVLQICQSQS